MRLFVAILALLWTASLPFAQGIEPPQVAAFRAEMIAEAKARGEKELVVTFTGETMDVPEGAAPLVIVTREDLPHECMVMLHPTEQLSAVLGCAPKEAAGAKPQGQGGWEMMPDSSKVLLQI